MEAIHLDCTTIQVCFDHCSWHGRHHSLWSSPSRTSKIQPCHSDPPFSPDGPWDGRHLHHHGGLPQHWCHFVEWGAGFRSIEKGRAFYICDICDWSGSFSHGSLYWAAGFKGFCRACMPGNLLWFSVSGNHIHDWIALASINCHVIKNRIRLEFVQFVTSLQPIMHIPNYTIIQHVDTSFWNTEFLGLLSFNVNILNSSQLIFWSFFGGH